MPVTVGDFYEDLRVVIARGNTTDERLKVWSRVALRFLEREFTFDYMKNMYFLIMEPGSRSFNFAKQDPPIPLKEIEAIGYYGGDGGMIQFKRRNVFSLAGMNGRLDSTYRTMQSQIIFEGTTTPPGLTTETQAYPIQLHNSIFTEWPTDPNATHPILDICDDLMKYQVLLSSTPSLRKQSELQGWKFMRDEAITGLRRLEDSKELEDDVRMEYWGGHDGRLFSSASEAIAHICGMYDVPSTFGIAGLYLVSCGMGGSGETPATPVETHDELLMEDGELFHLESGDGVLLLESSS
jgi:hypothetical protein